MAALRILNGLRKISLNYPSQTVNICSFYPQHEGLQRLFSSKVQNNLDETEADKKKKTVPVPKVTLISTDESIQVVTLEQAKKISDRRNLKLVKIIDLDTKTQRPVFKLMTGHEYVAADLKHRENKKLEKKNSFIKGEKLLLLNSQISEHDLDSKIKKIQQWIAKHYEVRVVISGAESHMNLCESVFKQMESKLQIECRILQKRTKGNELKFQILPQKNASTSSNKDNKSNDDSL